MIIFSKASALAFGILLTASCVRQKPLTAFRVLPTSPAYRLQSPDALETPFPEILRAFNGYEPSKSWIDLRPLMALRIENAYYRSGVERKGLSGFLGTEVAVYKVANRGGLRLASDRPLADRPNDQAPAREFIRPIERLHRYYRFYFAVVFKRSGNRRGSLLLGAGSKTELERLAAELADDPDAACEGGSSYCTVFPETCTVAVEMEIVVNDSPQNVAWGSQLGNVAAHAQQIEFSRLHKGRLTPVELDVQDANAGRLPLLPGDHVNWK